MGWEGFERPPQIQRPLTTRELEATPEAVRTVAARNGLPVDGIDEVRVLDPYFHH
jgi:hypothetical protein